MVSSRGVSAVVCVMTGLGCIAGVALSHPGGTGAAGTEAMTPAAPPPPGRGSAAAPPSPAAPPRPAFAANEVDTELPTGSIAPGSAVHVPNPAAYRGAPKMGDPVTVAGAEAINYLAGNTLRREGPGESGSTYFASRGLMGEGDERAFTARRWDRERPDLCEVGRNGRTLCRPVSILLDGRYEFPGARLGTVTLGAAEGAPAVTAALVKGNAIRFPEHIPFLDSTVGAAETEAPAAAAGDLAGRVAAVAAEGAGPRGRQTVYFAEDDRRLELQQVQAGDGKAVQVTVGRWRVAKGSLCQARTVGGAQSCFKVEAAAGGLRLVPAGKAGGGQTATILSETGAREVAQD